MPYDSETGLYAAGPRSYDPGVGEFLSPYPEGYAGGTAPWSYAGGNPIVAQDPSGRLFFVAIGAALAGYQVYRGLRDLAQSAEARRVKQSYKSMTELDKPDALEQATQAHRRLATAAKKGGETAIKATKTAIGAVLNPTRTVGDVAEAVTEQLGEAVEEAATGSDSGGDDDE